MAELNLRLRQAIAAARAGKAPQAILLAKSALEEDPEDVNALLLLSALAETQEQQAEYLDRIVAKDPDHAIAKKRLAQLRDVPAAATGTPADTSEAADAETVSVSATPTEPTEDQAALPDDWRASTLKAGEPEAEPAGEAVESTAEDAGAIVAEDAKEPLVEDDEFPLTEQLVVASTRETPETAFEEPSESLFEEAEAAADPFYEQVETPMPDEIAESSFEDSPAFEAETIEEPSFEEVETPLPDELIEPSAAESALFESEELPEVFARKLDALLPKEMAEQMAEALETPSVEETQEPLLENVEPFPFEEGAQPSFEVAPEETSEPDFDDAYTLPAMEEPDYPVDDPASTLLDEALELPDRPVQEEFLSELHEFPVEDLRKPAALAEDAGPSDLYSETPDAPGADFYEPAPLETDEFDAEEAAPPEEQSPERPFLAVTAPLSHDVVESPPDAREGLAAQLDEELSEEAGPDFENLIDRTSPEADQVLAASVTGLESQQDDEIGNEDVFASLVEEVTGTGSEDADLVAGIEPAADSDIPEWLREAEDSSLAAVEDSSISTYQVPAELNDIPAWLLDDGEEEWLESEPETIIAPTISSEESFDTEGAPDVAAEAHVAAPAAVAAYSDDEIDAAMASIIDDEVDVDSYVTGSALEESAEMHSVDPVDAAAGEQSSGTVSTRALEIFLIVLVVVAVFVLAALALVVFNPFS